MQESQLSGQAEEGALQMPDLVLKGSGLSLQAEGPVSVMIMIPGLGDRHGLKLYSSTVGLRLMRERMH